jgi:NAD(P)-dependent dehydrogenase (short-subunit alcohol dehydrogenase family)
MKSVAGRTVLVTGAAMGMGRLFVERAIAERAAHVILWDRDEEALSRTLADLEEASSATQLTAYVIDVTDLGTVQATAAEILATVGPVDILVNNAGIVRGNAYFWESDPVADTEATIAVNTLAPGGAFVYPLL